jgi:hypothetical protein
MSKCYVSKPPNSESYKGNNISITKVSNRFKNQILLDELEKFDKEINKEINKEIEM